MNIEIRDLNDKTMAAYLCCGCPPTDEKVAAQDGKREWTDRMIPKGLGAKIAFDDGCPAGFVNYLPVEVAPAPVEGQGCLFILCIHVESEGKGVGKALINATEEYATAQEFTGLATIGTGGHMPASFYEHVGFAQVDRHEDTRLMWKPFGEAAPPSLMRTTIAPTCEPNAVHMDYAYTAFCNCLHMIRKLVAEFDGRVILHEHCIDDRQEMDVQCGAVIGAVFVDGERAMTPPTGADDWRRRITEALRAKGLDSEQDT